MHPLQAFALGAVSTLVFLIILDWLYVHWVDK